MCKCDICFSVLYQPTLSDRARELRLICTPSMEGGALGLRAVTAAKAGLSSNFDTH